jgi:hypothetical protein
MIQNDNARGLLVIAISSRMKIFELKYLAQKHKKHGKIRTRDMTLAFYGFCFFKKHDLYSSLLS